MEFSLPASDEDSSFLYKPSDGYYASQVLHSGILGRAAMHSLPPPLSEREAIAREIMKEQIREEILDKEMAERRILEEEVRREIEIERIREIRRFHMERFSLLSGNTDMVIHGDRGTQSFMPSWTHARGRASLQRECMPDAAEFAFRERSPSHLLPKKSPVYATQSYWHNKLEKYSPLEETTTSNSKTSGSKRKTCGEFSLPSKKQWGCALCEVSSTSERALNEHLQGKRHKTKEALLNPKKTNVTVKSNSASPRGFGKKKQPAMKGASATGPKKEQKQRFWCGICKVKCNSKNMLERHFNGKKHKSLMELKKDNNRLEKAVKEGGANEKQCEN